MNILKNKYLKKLSGGSQEHLTVDTRARTGIITSINTPSVGSLGLGAFNGSRNGGFIDGALCFIPHGNK